MLKKIILSRFKKDKEEDWVKDRREICLECEYNSINSGSFRGYKFFLATLSYFYSYITGRAKEDTLGVCTLCGCSLFYKTQDIGSECDLNKWDKLDNGSIRLNIRETRNK